MKNQGRPRRTRLHRRLKAPAGAYSGRYGPLTARPAAEVVATGAATDPWLNARPVLGLTAAIMPAGSAVLRRP